MSRPAASTATSRGDYTERLFVPLRWWVQTTMLVASLWLAFVVALPLWFANLAAGGIALVATGLLLNLGRARVGVADGHLSAGPARIPVGLLGPAEPLDADGTRRVHGVDADARAFLMTRPYLKRSVRVPVHDPDDPAPYWLVSTRHPRRLSAALEAARETGRGSARDHA